MYETGGRGSGTGRRLTAVAVGIGRPHRGHLRGDERSMRVVRSGRKRRRHSRRCMIPVLDDAGTCWMGCKNSPTVIRRSNEEHQKELILHLHNKTQAVQMMQEE